MVWRLGVPRYLGIYINIYTHEQIDMNKLIIEDILIYENIYINCTHTIPYDFLTIGNRARVI